MTEKKEFLQPTKTNSSAPADGNTNAMLTYLVGWVTGLIFLLTEKKDKLVRFHAAQSVIVFGSLNLLMLVPVIGWALSPILSLLMVALWVFLMIKAYQGEMFKLPYAGDYAEKLMEKIK